uniref:Uncharacterized protein n=1 Tax=viral metagenome TaxID=1070528 RepID=A0A6H2A0V5_9ZZZZ
MKTKHILLLCVIIAFIFTIAGFALHDVIFPQRELIIDTTDWEAVRNWEQIARNSMIIARKLHDFKPRPVYIAGDTIWIDPTTQVQNVPVQLYSECHNVPLLVNSDTNYIPVTVEAEYQLLNFIRLSTNPMPYPIKIKQQQTSVRFWAYGAVSVNTQKRLLLETRAGVYIGEHLFIYGGSRLDSQLEATAEAGLGWRL